MMQLWQSFLRIKQDQDGQALVEYALILALIAVGVVTILSGLGGKIGTLLTSITGSL